MTVVIACDVIDKFHTLIGTVLVIPAFHFAPLNRDECPVLNDEILGCVIGNWQV